MNARQLIEAESPKGFIQKAGELPIPGWEKSLDRWTAVYRTTVKGYLGDLQKNTVYAEAFPYNTGYYVEVDIDAAPWTSRRMQARFSNSDENQVKGRLRRIAGIVQQQNEEPVGLNELENLFRVALDLKPRPLPRM